MISDQHKIIYVHIPKCAGTSVDRFFGFTHGGHDTAKMIKKKFSLEYDNYFNFTIVRNTWARVFFLYSYHSRRSMSPYVSMIFREWVRSEMPVHCNDYWTCWKPRGGVNPLSGMEYRR